MNDTNLAIEKNTQSMNNYYDNYINKFKKKKKSLKNNLKKKYSIWTKKYNSVYMQERKKGLNEDFYSSSCSSLESLESDDYASAKESLEALKYLDNLSIEELRNLTTIDLDTLKKNNIKSEEHTFSNPEKVENENEKEKEKVEENKNEEEIVGEEEKIVNEEEVVNEEKEEIKKENEINEIKDREVNIKIELEGEEINDFDNYNLNSEKERMDDQDSINSSVSSEELENSNNNYLRPNQSERIFIGLNDTNDKSKERDLSHEELNKLNENKIRRTLHKAASTSFILDDDNSYNTDKNIDASKLLNGNFEIL